VLKSLIDLAQGTRMINYYLFAGGINARLDEPVGDGNDRIAFTGERHGFAAPIGPEGDPSPALAGVETAAQAVRDHARLFAMGAQLTDDLVLGFVADHYLTEYRHPAASARADQVRDRELHRGLGVRQTLGRALVFGGWSFGALDLQAAAGSDDEWSAGAPVDDRPGIERELIVLAAGRELGRGVQEFLVRHLETGGRMLLAGALPDQDADGTPCTLLADALGVWSAGSVAESMHADGQYFPSVRAVGPMAEHGAREVRVTRAQLFAGAGEPLLRESGTGQPAAVRVETTGGGVAVLLGADYPVHLPFWRSLLDLAGVRPRLELVADRVGVIAIPVADERETAIVAVNVAPYAVTFSPLFDGAPVADDPVVLAPRGHAILRGLPVTARRA